MDEGDRPAARRGVVLSGRGLGAMKGALAVMGLAGLLAWAGKVDWALGLLGVLVAGTVLWQWLSS